MREFESEVDAVAVAYARERKLTPVYVSDRYELKVSLQWWFP